MSHFPTLHRISTAACGATGLPNRLCGRKHPGDLQAKGGEETVYAAGGAYVCVCGALPTAVSVGGCTVVRHHHNQTKGYMLTFNPSSNVATPRCQQASQSDHLSRSVMFDCDLPPTLFRLFVRPLLPWLNPNTFAAATPCTFHHFEYKTPCF